ncbi:putative inorganic phosphate cotransporter [Frankliniella occidentalis]|uniref:Inorganic phosphate cotransporter n=1 Tax=Frankliniella occidentalis TaxID=133901 RepID=A0A9C6X9Y4_FRAOC|nr:putative inorganic phosphate cotransporter [Frankliniella occidentalis]
MTLLLFLGMANAYVMRTNMSVAIVAMVNHTALPHASSEAVDMEDCGAGAGQASKKHDADSDGEFVWNTYTQSYILSSFFYGYVVTQIPFGVLAKRYGAKYFLGVGMLINSVFGLLVPVAAYAGVGPLIVVRFIQGLGEGPIVPCTHALLAKWVPPNERSRMGAFVYAGAQFGTVVSMPLSGLLAAYGFAGGWPSIFYVFGIVGTVWSLVFLFYGHEDPESHPTIDPAERKYILTSLWGSAGVSSPPIPWVSILKSMPFWAILMAHIGQNYGYETLMTELPTFMKQVLHFDIKQNGTASALPYLAMWIFSMLLSVVTDWMISTRISHTAARRIVNCIGTIQ